MKKKHPEHVNLERWLVSYADFVTLLFATFVMLFALSQVNKSKIAQVAASIRKAFGSAGPVGMVDLGGSSGGDTANPFDTLDSPEGRIHNLPAGKTNTSADPDPELQEMKELLEETVSLELGATETSEKLQMQFDSRGLVVRVATKDFFDDGEVECRPDLRPILDRIGRVVASSRRLVRIEGHTDQGEIKHVGAHASDWELSAARAAWVAKYWMNRQSINPKRVGIAGYSHFRPLSNGRQPWERAKNRRVEIIILNNRYEE